VSLNPESAPPSAPPCPVHSTFDARLRGLTTALIVAVLLVMSYGWVLRLGDDLGWDEALNLRVYSRHPLTSVALMREPNNHPFESLFKSLFVWGFGMKRDVELKFPGYLVGVTYLLTAVLLFRLMARRGAWSAGVATLMLLVVNYATNAQVMNMRGYMMTMTLALVYLYRVASHAEWFSAESLAESPVLSRRRFLEYAALLTILLYTLPSNIVTCSILACATAVSYRWNERSHPGFSSWLKTAAALMTTVSIGALFLYAPLIFSNFVGLSRIRYVKLNTDVSVGDGILRGFDSLAKLAAPVGVSPYLFATAAGILAAIAAFRMRRCSSARVGLVLIAVTMAAHFATCAVGKYATRVMSTLVPLVLIGLGSAIHALSRKRSTRSQSVLGAIIAAAALWPAGAAHTKVEFARNIDRAAAFIAAIAQSKECSPLVCHSALEPVQARLIRDFPRSRIAEVQHAFDRKPAESNWVESGSISFGKKLRDRLFPDQFVALVPPDNVDVLFVIGFSDLSVDEDVHRWQHPEFKALMARLKHTGTYRFDELSVDVYEK
jgi:hypothetical protein